MMVAKFACLLVILILQFDAQARCNDIRLRGNIDRASLWSDITVLAADDMQGRQTGSIGADKARDFISGRYQQIGLHSFNQIELYQQPFIHQSLFGDVKATNIVGWLPGTELSQQFIVVTAHFDHIGKSGRKVFNGADDNASGVAAMLAIAAQIVEKQTRHSIIFVATDAEEKGLYGAKAFLLDPPVPLQAIKYNLNLDMLAQGGRRNKLYVSGARQHKELKTVVQQTIDEAGLCLVDGHRQVSRGFGGGGKVNWRKASDHAAFARQGIGYLFVSVNVHPDYHTVHDEIDNIDSAFYTAAAETSLLLLRNMDKL